MKKQLQNIAINLLLLTGFFSGLFPMPVSSLELRKIPLPESKKVLSLNCASEGVDIEIWHTENGGYVYLARQGNRILVVGAQGKKKSGEGLTYYDFLREDQSLYYRVWDGTLDSDSDGYITGFSADGSLLFEMFCRKI